MARRNAKISVSLSPSLPGNSRSSATTFVRPRYASRSNMTWHHPASRCATRTRVGAQAKIGTQARTASDQYGRISRAQRRSNSSLRPPLPAVEKTWRHPPPVLIGSAPQRPVASPYTKSAVAAAMTKLQRKMIASIWMTTGVSTPATPTATVAPMPPIVAERRLASFVARSPRRVARRANARNP
jgi:hypothetical protein